MSSCIGCRYSQPAHMTTDDTIVLECHRHPPTVTLAGHDIDDIVRLWPQVDPDDWCGEHTPSDQLPPPPRRCTSHATLIGQATTTGAQCVLPEGHDGWHSDGNLPLPLQWTERQP